jgi:hypothetical protein
MRWYHYLGIAAVAIVGLIGLPILLASRAAAKSASGTPEDELLARAKATEQIKKTAPWLLWGFNSREEALDRCAACEGEDWDWNPLTSDSDEDCVDSHRRCGGEIAGWCKQQGYCYDTCNRNEC